MQVSFIYLFIFSETRVLRPCWSRTRLVGGQPCKQTQKNTRVSERTLLFLSGFPVPPWSALTAGSEVMRTEVPEWRMVVLLVLALRGAVFCEAPEWLRSCRWSAVMLSWDGWMKPIQEETAVYLLDSFKLGHQAHLLLMFLSIFTMRPTVLDLKLKCFQFSPISGAVFSPWWLVQMFSDGFQACPRVQAPNRVKKEGLQCLLKT